MRLKGILATGVVIIGAAVCFVGGANIGPMLGFGASQQETAPVVTVDTTLVKNSFADIGELATESYVFTQVGKYSEEPSSSVWKYRVPALITSSPIRAR